MGSQHQLVPRPPLGAWPRSVLLLPTSRCCLLPEIELRIAADLLAKRFGAQRHPERTPRSHHPTPCTSSKACRAPTPHYLKVSACLKHLIAYGTEVGPPTRMEFGDVVAAQDMADSYEVGFKAGVQQGNVSCMMCSCTFPSSFFLVEASCA